MTLPMKCEASMIGNWQDGRHEPEPHSDFRHRVREQEHGATYETAAGEHRWRGRGQPAGKVLRNACDTTPGLNCFKATEQGARGDERDEKVHNAEDEKRRKDLVAGHFVRKAHEDDGLEHAETAGNMADDTRRQGDDENRQHMRIAGGSRVRKTHEEDSAGKGQIRQGQADLGEGGDRAAAPSARNRRARGAAPTTRARHTPLRAREPRPQKQCSSLAAVPYPLTPRRGAAQSPET